MSFAQFIRIALVLGFYLFISSKVHSQKNRQRNAAGFGVTVSFPYVNGYHYHDYYKNKTATKAGFGGVGIAVFYKKQKNKWSINYGLTADLPAPIGPIDYGHEGTRSSIGATVVDLFWHRNVYWRFNIIGGIGLT